MSRKIHSYICALIVAAGATAGLSACNGSNGQTNAVESDWIHDSSTGAPTPNPTTSAAPQPSPSATSTPIDVSTLYSGPASVAPYVQKFVEDAKIQGVDVLPDMDNPKLTIQIASLSAYGSSVIGLCETGGGQRRVTFEPNFWNSVSETQRELLAHHELGHCVLYRAHKTTLLASGAYASIMYPIIMSSSTYLNNYDYYQQELFTQSARALGTSSSSQAAAQVHTCTKADLGMAN